MVCLVVVVVIVETKKYDLRKKKREAEDEEKEKEEDEDDDDEAKWKEKRTATVDEVLKSTETELLKTVCVFVSWHTVLLTLLQIEKKRKSLAKSRNETLRNTCTRMTNDVDQNNEKIFRFILRRLRSYQ